MSLGAAVDRLQEAHFFLHELEEFYHFASPFRWHLNAFLRAIKEVSQLIQVAFQSQPGFSGWYRPKQEALGSDSLIKILAKQRNFIVHQGMLLPVSTALAGISWGSGLKHGLTIPLDPMLDSDVAMEGFVENLRKAGDPFGYLDVDDEDTVPCIERRWALKEFPQDELVDLCANAWLKVAELLRAVYIWNGQQVDEPTLPCRHNSQAVRLRLYSREDIAAGRFKGFHLGVGARA